MHVNHTGYEATSTSDIKMKFIGSYPFVEKVELNPGTVREFKKTLPENKTVI